MISSPDSRLTDLFVRYWDNTLTDADAAELEHRLTNSSAEREWFRLLSLQAVTDEAGTRPTGADPRHPPQGAQTSHLGQRRDL